nr:vesicle transport protein, Use1 [Tanacetum cinerariifolium]
MGLSKTEINLRRLLAAAPNQQHLPKLIHYVSTLREQLEQLAAERTPEGLPRISKATLSDYSDKIEAIAANLASPESNDVISLEPLTADTSDNVNITKAEEESINPSPGLRRRNKPLSSVEDRGKTTVDAIDTGPIKLDDAAHAHISKHRKLQEDLTDEMVGLARQLKESTLMMNQSIKNTEKILDSTEQAVEHSLASTGRANTQAVAIYSETSKTSCFTWLVMLLMTLVVQTPFSVLWRFRNCLRFDLKPFREDTLLDVTKEIGIDIVNPSGLSSRGFIAGQVALKAASGKVTKHEKACIENQHVFILFAFDTFGFLAPEAVELLSRVQRVMHSNVMRPRSTDVVFKHVDETGRVETKKVEKHFVSIVLNWPDGIIDHHIEERLELILKGTRFNKEADKLK